MNDIPTSPQPSAERLAVWAIGWRRRGIAAWGFSYLPSSLFGAFVPRCQDHQMGMVPYRRLFTFFLCTFCFFFPFFLQIIGEKSDADSHLSWLGVLWKHGVCMQISIQIHIPGCPVDIDIQKDVLGIHIYTQMHCTVCMYWYTSMNIKVNGVYIDVLYSLFIWNRDFFYRGS